MLREYQDFYNTHRPHRTLKQAAPLRPLPGGVTDLGHFRVQWRDPAGGVIHEYCLVTYVFGTRRLIDDGCTGGPEHVDVRVDVVRLDVGDPSAFGGVERCRR